MPSVETVHIDQALTNISVAYMNSQFISDMIFKPVIVSKQSDKYYVYGKERFRQHDDRRAPGTEANEIQWELSTDQYFCEGHALRHAISDEEAQNADAIFDLQADATELVTEGILLNKEVDASNKLLDVDNYDSDLVKIFSTTEKWSADNTDPLADIVHAQEQIHAKSGLKPNTLIVSEPVFNVLKLHPALIDKVKYVREGILTSDILASLFGVSSILIGSALKSTATNPGMSDNLLYVWGNSAVLAYIPERAGSKVPAIGYSFMWNKDNGGAVQVRQWYNQERRATLIEAERWYDQKIVSKVAGYLLSGVI